MCFDLLVVLRAPNLKQLWLLKPTPMMKKMEHFSYFSKKSRFKDAHRHRGKSFENFLKKFQKTKCFQKSEFLFLFNTDAITLRPPRHGQCFFLLGGPLPRFPKNITEIMQKINLCEKLMLWHDICACSDFTN